MKIQAVSSPITFEAKKFRLKMNSIEYIDPNSGHSFSAHMFWAREYSNPNAEMLYKRANATKDIKEKAKLYNEMGHYQMFLYGSGIVGFLRSLFNLPKKLYSDNKTLALISDLAGLNRKAKV